MIGLHRCNTFRNVRSCKNVPFAVLECGDGRINVALVCVTFLDSRIYNGRGLRFHGAQYCELLIIQELIAIDNPRDQLLHVNLYPKPAIDVIDSR